VKRLINATADLRMKALVAVCYECGLRVGEALTLKVGDVHLEEQCGKLTVSGKTGSRQCYSIESLALLIQWLDAHPDRSNPDAWLWTDDTEPLKYDRARFKLLELKRKAGISKRLYFHLFRHSSATKNAELGEPMLRELHGWSKNSNEPSTYVHLSNAAVKQTLLLKHGLKQKAEEPKVIMCPRCSTPNPPDSRLCAKCKSVLRLEDAISIGDIQKEIVEQSKVIQRMQTQIDMMLQGTIERDRTYFERKYPGLKKQKIRGLEVGSQDR